MTHPTQAEQELATCPFCPGGETRVDEKRLSPTMNGQGAIIAAELHHWCEKRPGITRQHIVISGRERADAIAAWQTRSPHTAARGTETLVDVAALEKVESRIASWEEAIECEESCVAHVLEAAAIIRELYALFPRPPISIHD